MAARRRKVRRRPTPRPRAAISSGRTTPTRRPASTSLPKVSWGKGARTTGRAAQKAGRWGWRRYQAMSPDHRRDIGGGVLVMTGVALSATSWFHAGVLGRVAAPLIWAMIGWPAYVLPIIIVTIGVVMVRLPPRGGHRIIGGVALGAGVLGLLHLAAPTHRPGGQVGAIVGGGLAQAVWTVPAALILLVAVILGGVLLGRTRVTAVPGHLTQLRRGRGVVEGDVVGGEVVGVVDTDDDEDDQDDDVDSDGDDDEPVPARPVRQPTNRPTRTPGPPSAPQHTPTPAARPRQLALTDSTYELPPSTLLGAGSKPQARTKDNDQTIGWLNEFFTQFKIGAEFVDYTRGPTVTQYAYRLGPGVSAAKLKQREDDVKIAARSVGGVRLVIPIPDTDTVGIEIPNRSRDGVALGDVLRSARALADPNPLLVAIGQAIDGSYVLGNIGAWPHAIIAGTTGAGKSVGLNGLLVSIMTRATPDEVGLLLIDPKQVELAPYDGIPHLIEPIVADEDPEECAAKAGAALRRVIVDMDARYKKFRAAGVKEIGEYNKKVRAGLIEGPIMAHRLIVVDELADLIIVAKEMKKESKKDDLDNDPGIESSLVRIGQKGRAAGDHLVLATQRPSADVITGLISVNTPTRLAFAVQKFNDSMIVLGEVGAEKLTGKGDGLYLPAGAQGTIRIQSPMVTQDEVDAVVKWWIDQATKQRQEAQASA